MDRYGFAATFSFQFHDRVREAVGSFGTGYGDQRHTVTNERRNFSVEAAEGQNWR